MKLLSPGTWEQSRFSVRRLGSQIWENFPELCPACVEVEVPSRHPARVQGWQWRRGALEVRGEDRLRVWESVSPT